MSRITSTFGALGAVALTAAVLTGCSAPAGESGEPEPAAQTVAEACDVLEADMQAVSEELQGALSTLASDPASSTELLESLAATLEDSASGLGNAEVKAAAETAAAAMGTIAEEAAAVFEDPANADLEALQAATEGMQDDFVAIGELCS